MKNILLVLSALLITACSDEAKQTATVIQEPSEQPVQRSFDYAELTKGKQLFLKNCAVCHGTEAEGATNWQQRDPDGKFPAPPLNGTAHAWHHSLDNLRETIKKGTIRLGGKMPPWQGTLSDKDIDAIITWFQSRWSDEIYSVWYRTQQAPTQNK